MLHVIAAFCIKNLYNVLASKNTAAIFKWQLF